MKIAAYFSCEGMEVLCSACFTPTYTNLIPVIVLCTWYLVLHRPVPSSVSASSIFSWLQKWKDRVPLTMPYHWEIRYIKGELILHADLGSQYTSKAYIEFCESVYVTQSVSKAEYPYDNVPMERYFNTLQNECINLYEDGTYNK